MELPEAASSSPPAMRPDLRPDIGLDLGPGLPQWDLEADALDFSDSQGPGGQRARMSLSGAEREWDPLAEVGKLRPGS